MMADLASSIMRRRASIEPQEDDDVGDTPAGRASGEAVLGLRAYLASKDASQPSGGQDDDW